MTKSQLDLDKRSARKQDSGSVSFSIILLRRIEHNLLPTEYSNYHPLRLLSHIMQILECILCSQFESELICFGRIIIGRKWGRASKDNIVIVPTSCSNMWWGTVLATVTMVAGLWIFPTYTASPLHLITRVTHPECIREALKSTWMDIFLNTGDFRRNNDGRKVTKRIFLT